MLANLLPRAALGSCRSQQSSLAALTQQLRFIGGDKVPEYYGRPSAYTEGTNFLGTPKNHLDLVERRPLSPDVLEIDGKSVHYKFPWGAISSIMNRGTGVALSVGFTAAGYVALTGDLPSVLVLVRNEYPALAVLAKFSISFPLVYHYLGGIRHVVWDLYPIGNQADKNSLLELDRVELSSKVIVGASLATSVILSIL